MVNLQFPGAIYLVIRLYITLNYAPSKKKCIKVCLAFVLQRNSVLHTILPSHQEPEDFTYKSIPLNKCPVYPFKSCLSACEASQRPPPLPTAVATVLLSLAPSYGEGTIFTCKNQELPEALDGYLKVELLLGSLRQNF